MKLDITGDTGQNNTYQQNNVESTGSFNPNATTVNYYYKQSQSRLGSYFERLEQEILKNVNEEVIEELIFYKTKLNGTRGLERKLQDGNFKQSKINDAIRLKELYAKKATKFECYPSAQRINLDLFARIKHEFETNITPLIEEETPLKTVMSEVREKIVKPIMALINENGAHDMYLQYNEDHIYGMIYYLTGMCHLNWKDYDNV